MNIANLVQAISGIIWVVAIGAIIFIVVSSWRNRPVKNGFGIGAGAIVLAILLTTISAGLVFINPQERGVVISALSPTGYREEALQPGLRFVVPFAESVILYPISKQTYTMSIATNEGQVQGDDSIAARTSDGQEIYVDASVIYQIDPAKVVQVHIQWQNRYGDDLVRSQARGIIRDVVSQFGVEEVVSSQRAEMIRLITEQLETKLSENGLMLVDFVLRNIAFSDEYSASVEQKQISEQQAQQAALVVEQRRQEAEQARQVAQGQADAAVIAAQGAAQARIIEAQAEAEALGLIADALRDNPDLLTYQYINKLSPNVSVMMVPSSTPFLFNVPELSQSAQ